MLELLLTTCNVDEVVHSCYFLWVGPAHLLIASEIRVDHYEVLLRVRRQPTLITRMLKGWTELISQGRGQTITSD
jgi:hypothetical protein